MAIGCREGRVHFPFAAAFFFLAAHAAFIRSDIFFRNAMLFAADVSRLAAAGALAGAALSSTATGAGAAFAALIAAQRFFVAAIIALLPAALSFRFAGAAGTTGGAGFGACSTGSGASDVVGPWRASIAASSLSRSIRSRARI